MTTTVFNLSTTEEREYSLSPKEAVKAAYLQDKGNWNTWEYDGIDVTIEESDKVVACYNWAAIKREEV